MRKIAFAVCLIVLFTAVAAPALAAEDGKWMVRLRALRLDPADKSDAFTAGIADIPADALTINKKTFPEVDISYFFTPNIAAELVLTYPQSQDVSLLGTKIGSFKHLPPVLSVQYHFLPEGTFRPYVGVGLNYTIISDVDLTVDVPISNDEGPTRATFVTVHPDLEKHSIGFSYGAGFDVKVADKWFINFDVKKVKLGSDVLVEGEKITHVDIDPLLISLGAGYRF